jgi:hypothetical protein
MDNIAHLAKADLDATFINTAKWEERMTLFCSPSSLGFPGVELELEEASPDDCWAVREPLVALLSAL